MSHQGLYKMSLFWLAAWDGKNMCWAWCAGLVGLSGHKSKSIYFQSAYPLHPVRTEFWEEFHPIFRNLVQLQSPLQSLWEDSPWGEGAPGTSVRPWGLWNTHLKVPSSRPKNFTWGELGQFFALQEECYVWEFFSIHVPLNTSASMELQHKIGQGRGAWPSKHYWMPTTVSPNQHCQWSGTMEVVVQQQLEVFRFPIPGKYEIAFRHPVFFSTGGSNPAKHAFYFENIRTHLLYKIKVHLV